MSAFYQTSFWRSYAPTPRPEMGWVAGWRQQVLWILAGAIAQRHEQHIFENAAAAMADPGVTGSADGTGDPVSPRPRNKRRRKRGHR